MQNHHCYREPQQQTWWRQGLKVKPRILWHKLLLRSAAPCCFCNLWPRQPRVNPSGQPPISEVLLFPDGLMSSFVSLLWYLFKSVLHLVREPRWCSLKLVRLSLSARNTSIDSSRQSMWLLGGGEGSQMLLVFHGFPKRGSSLSEYWSFVFTEAKSLS